MFSKIYSSQSQNEKYKKILFEWIIVSTNQLKTFVFIFHSSPTFKSFLCQSSKTKLTFTHWLTNKTNHFFIKLGSSKF